MSEPDPAVLIVSGPSGSGKSTLVRKMLELPGTMLSVSCTTRPPRAEECSGKWYNFVSEEQFHEMAQGGEFLEYAQLFGKHWYGTPRRWLEQARDRRLDLVLEIDVQGAQQVKSKIPAAVAIFILPPSRGELYKRIRARGQDLPEEIARRLDQARGELEYFAQYDYAVVNDDLERAGGEVQAIVLAARCQVARKRSRVQEILKSFGG